MSSSKPFKIFTALALPKDVRDSLCDVQKRISAALNDEYRAVRAENLHITLTFVGHVSEGELEIIKTKLKSVPCSDFQLQIEKIEMPAKKRLGANFIWAKISLTDRLLELQSSGEAALADFIAQKKFRFEPHVTLFRLKKIRHAGQIQKIIAGLPFSPITFRRKTFSLFRSKQHAGEVHYRELACYGCPSSPSPSPV